MADILVKCCRCRNKHRESERQPVPSKRHKGLGVSNMVCPRCGAKDYYMVAPQPDAAKPEVG